MRKSSLLALALLAPGFASAAGSALPDDFNALFAMTCMKHFYSQNELREAMNAQSDGVLSGEQAKYFLQGSPGTAWSVTAPSAKYVVALRDDTLCLVFAQRAVSSAVQRGFVALVSSAPDPLVAIKLNDPSLGPNRGTTRTIAYSWGRPEDDSELLFTLTTTDDVDATTQALASMALVNKLGNPPKVKLH